MAGNTIDLHLHDLDHDRDHDRDRDRDDQADDDALSLCDFPLGLELDDDVDDKNPENENELGKLWPAKTQEAAAAAPEFFEFFSDHSSEMCAADDIIFRGKLIPLELPPLPPPPPSPQQKQPPLSIQPPKRRSFDEYRSRRNNRGGLGKRSESLSELCTRTRSDRADDKTSLLRNSRSLHHQSHQRRRDVEMRNSSTGSVGKSIVSPTKGAFKSRWYGFMFGKDKFTPEIELRDIKSRQCRRIPSLTSPPVEDGANKVAGNRSSGKVSSWGFLKALSCMDHANVAVTASVCIPQA